MNAKMNVGLTAKEALEVLTPDPQDDPEQSTMSESGLGLWSAGTSWNDRDYDELVVGPDGFLLGDRNFLLEPLVNGGWYATGFRVPVEPTSHPEQIPTRLWAVLYLDFDSNTASGGGLEYQGLEFHKREADADEPPAARFQNVADVQRAYDEHVEAARLETGLPPTWKNDEAWRSVHTVTRDRLRELRKESPARSQEDRKPGPQKLAD